MKSYEYMILGVALVAWLTPFVLTGWHSKGTTVKDSRSRWGVLLQMLGYAALWQGHFWERTLAAWQVALSVVLLGLAVLLGWTGARALGRHLRLDAALRADHQLVRSGPYRFVRHPIYASMLCLLLGNAVMIAGPAFFVTGLALFLIGTEIRVRIEDRLLAERFGMEFVAYRRRVSAYIPFVR